MMNKGFRFFCYIALFSLLSCIKNDLPYPVVELSILSVEGTGVYL